MREQGRVVIGKGYVVILFIICTLAVLINTDVAAETGQEKNNLTFGMAKKNLVKGVTTQAEVLGLFGAPNITTRNKSGEEVWTYDKMAVSKEDVSGGLSLTGAVPGGGGIIGGSLGTTTSSSSTSSKSITLIITFDGKDVVKDYAVMAQEF
jgi:hypothetical protein